MKKLFGVALVMALCAGPAMARAETPAPPRYLAAPAQQDPQARREWNGVELRAEDDASDYAAREQAAPQQVFDFAGGADGVYIGSGVLLAALLVVLILVAL